MKTLWLIENLSVTHTALQKKNSKTINIYTEIPKIIVINWNYWKCAAVKWPGIVVDSPLLLLSILQKFKPHYYSNFL